MGRRFAGLLFLLVLAGCTAQGAGGGAVAPVTGTGTGSNRVDFTVDGQSFAFRTPQVRHGRARAAEGVVAESFELASDDQTLYARLVLHVEAGREDLSGAYRATSFGREPIQPGQAELLLAEETDAARGRRMFPSGGGEVEVEQRDGFFVVRFRFTGDDLFRPADAEPVSGELSFHAPS